MELLNLKLTIFVKYHASTLCYLAAPGMAKEDNVEERENSEVTQFLVTGYVTDGQTDVRTDGRTDVRTDGWTERRGI